MARPHGVVFADYLKFFIPLVIVVRRGGPVLYPHLEPADSLFPSWCGPALARVVAW